MVSRRDYLFIGLAALSPRRQPKNNCDFGKTRPVWGPCDPPMWRKPCAARAGYRLQCMAALRRSDIGEEGVDFRAQENKMAGARPAFPKVFDQTWINQYFATTGLAQLKR
jgi:hypothetical protein